MGMEEGLTAAVGQIDGSSPRSLPEPPMSPARPAGPQARPPRSSTTASATEIAPVTSTLTRPARSHLRRPPERRDRASGRCCSSARPWVRAASGRSPGTSPTARSSPMTRAASSGASRTTRPATSTPEQHADDLHRIIGQLGGVPWTCSRAAAAPSTRSRWSRRIPTDVATLVAHEPPLAALVPDREAALATCRAVAETYQQRGFGAGMAHFITIVSPRRPVHGRDSRRSPGLTHRCSGCPPMTTARAPTRCSLQNLITSTAYEPDIERLERASTHIVIAVGDESERHPARPPGR